MSAQNQMLIPDQLLQAVVASEDYFKIKSKQNKEIQAIKKRHNDELAALITKFRQQALLAAATADPPREITESPVQGKSEKNQKRESEKPSEERSRGDLSREGSQEHLERDVPSNTTTTTTSSNSNNNAGASTSTDTGKKSEALEEMFQKQLETMGNLSRNKQDTIQKSENKPAKPSLNELKLKSQAEQMKNKIVSKSGGSSTEGTTSQHTSASGSSTPSNQQTPKRKHTSSSQMSEQLFNQSLNALNLPYILYTHEMKERRAKAKHFTVHDHGASGGQIVPPGYLPYSTSISGGSVTSNSGGGGEHYSAYAYSSSTSSALHLQSNADQDLSVNASGVGVVEMHSMTNSFSEPQQPPQPQATQPQQVLSRCTSRTSMEATSVSTSSTNPLSNCDVGSSVTDSSTSSSAQSGLVTSLGNPANT